jgi:hypothetical protein
MLKVTQGYHSRCHIWHIEAEYRVLMGREIGHGRDSQIDSTNVENGGEAVLIGVISPSVSP